MNLQEQYRTNANRYIKEEPTDTSSEESIDAMVTQAESLFWRQILEELEMSEPMGMDEELRWKGQIHPILVKFVSDFVRNS